MRSFIPLAAALATVSNALPCAAESCQLNEIPSTVVCGGNGYVAATDTPWYKKSQAEGTVEKCIDACTGGCKAVSFDTQYNTCYFYFSEVSKMKLYGKSTFNYFDRACTFEATPETVCGGNGYVAATNTPWYLKSQAEGTMGKCLEACKGGCKAVSFDTQYKTCYFYFSEVSKMKLYGKSSFHYFDRACKFENLDHTVCGQRGSVDESDPESYDSKVIASGVKDECLAYCHSDASCESVRYSPSDKKCYKYDVAVADAGVEFSAEATSLWYDEDCYKCTAAPEPERKA
ncbi:hypothetical protein LCI18_003509 [Fusarium solani-melongenae]|uniref:Uncharacterized protein n=1 Tax=Fusarium solani subsp. cucurbitae TaxID=2747967 RepID=A0ACD3YUD7_FUSSC|nr:hypothetical protein LCI18_003509 [Fusarium solani-melongenae]